MVPGPRRPVGDSETVTSDTVTHSDIDGQQTVRVRNRLSHLLIAGAAALTLAACSTAPDWAKPSTISDSITGTAPSEPTNETVAAAQEASDNQADGEGFPSAGTVPERPQTTSLEERRQVANSLVADRDHARYSGEALRGGTEPPASPLPSRRAEPLPEIPSAGADTAQTTSNEAGVIPEKDIPEFRQPTRRMGDPREGGRETETADAAEETTTADVAEATATNKIEATPLPEPARPEPAQAASAEPAEPASQPAVRQAAAAPAPEPEPVTQTREASPAPAPAARTTTAARQPAVPPRAVPTYVAEAEAAEELRTSRPAAAATAPVAVTTYGEPQFAASKAPPLPDNVRELVPGVVAARYDETVAGGTSAASGMTAPASGGDAITIDYEAIGAGSPVPDMEVDQGSALLRPADAEGGPFAPIAVYFGHGSASLTADDRDQIAEVATLHKERGYGTVRVVGHASSRTSNLPVDKHLMANFDMSMDRANAVAAELMQRGVAPSDLVIEAVGDRAPVYYESMPAGEAGNRRAEIFLE